MKINTVSLAFFQRCETGFGELGAGRPEKIPKGIEDLGIDGNKLAPPQPEHLQIRIFSWSNGKEVFEGYVENKTPAAFRVFWYYGPTREVITILAITTHP